MFRIGTDYGRNAPSWALTTPAPATERIRATMKVTDVLPRQVSEHEDRAAEQHPERGTVRVRVTNRAGQTIGSMIVADPAEGSELQLAQRLALEQGGGSTSLGAVYDLAVIAESAGFEPTADAPIDEESALAGEAEYRSLGRSRRRGPHARSPSDIAHTTLADRHQAAATGTFNSGRGIGGTARFVDDGGARARYAITAERLADYRSDADPGPEPARQLAAA